MFCKIKQYFSRVNIEQEDNKDIWLKSNQNQTNPRENNTDVQNIFNAVLNFTSILLPMILKREDVTFYEATTDFWHFSRQISIYIYSTIIALLVIVTLIRSFTFFYICMRASTRLHDNMFTSITRATMRFFNTNPAGRILNRFSKDMGAIDELLPAALIDCLQIGLSLLGIIVVVATVSPWLMVPTVIIGIIFYLLRIFYLKTSRNVKRLEGVSKYFLLVHLNHKFTFFFIL